MSCRKSGTSAATGPIAAMHGAVTSFCGVSGVSGSNRNDGVDEGAEDATHHLQGHQTAVVQQAVARLSTRGSDGSGLVSAALLAN
jgi:hypothetical protein